MRLWRIRVTGSLQRPWSIKATAAFAQRVCRAIAAVARREEHSNPDLCLHRVLSGAEECLDSHAAVPRVELKDGCSTPARKYMCYGFVNI
jgi:hypothetical protein